MASVVENVRKKVIVRLY